MGFCEWRHYEPLYKIEYFSADVQVRVCGKQVKEFWGNEACL